MVQRFEIAIPEAALSDLQQRLALTRWPDDFANDDWRYGANVDYLRELTAYWRETYDWRSRERLMNSFTQYKIELDGVAIHYLHVKGKGPNPVPLLLVHGWPWTFWDYRKVIGPLSDPAAYGGDPASAFDIIVPSLPGFGFSTPLREPGMNWWKTADLFVRLMEQAGYPRFLASGGDVGSFICAQLGHKYADRMLGIHLHTAGTLDFMTGGGWVDSDYAPDELHRVARMAAVRGSETGHFVIQSTKPQSLAVGLNDSPAGLLAWLVDKRRAWSDCAGQIESRFSKDDLLDTAMIYWLTQSYHTSARYYYEGAHVPWTSSHTREPVVEAPTAIALYPFELTFPPHVAAKRYYNLKQWTQFEAGGHFAPFEEPQSYTDDLRKFLLCLNEGQARH